MAAPAPVQVDVRILANPIEGPDDFQLVSGIYSGGMLNFRNNGHPGFIVMFRIVDEAVPPAGFRFPADPKDALWVRPIVVPAVPAAGGAAAVLNDECPDEACVWSQFEAQAVSGDGKRLIVRNRNEYTQRFGFVLRVSPLVGGNLQLIDPIGNNQNGPQ